MAEEPKDLFVYRLLGGISAGVGLLITFFAWDLAVIRTPRIRELLMDFGEPLPPATETVLRVPWLPLAFALLTTLIGVASVLFVRRWLIALAYVACFMTVGIAWAGEYSLEAPFRWVMQAVSAP
jgi:hypothetical protein